jgi:hypothetical protein
MGAGAQKKPGKGVPFGQRGREIRGQIFFSGLHGLITRVTAAPHHSRARIPEGSDGCS